MLSNDEILAKFQRDRKAAAGPTSPDLFAPDGRPARFEVGQWATIVNTRIEHCGDIGQVGDVRGEVVRLDIPLPGNMTRKVYLRHGDLERYEQLDRKLGPAPFDAPADAFDVALAKAIESAKATRAAWIADANEMLGLLTMASKPEDVNHSLTVVIIQKLREHINKA